ncbi:hypothetical protein HDU81_002751 [Chytriomyces hyalinus]|nr:hypothetical protein HDU81_002751 [Chytriomyces hyalinus]
MDAFLVLANSAKGAACAQLVLDALSAPGVFVFGELVECANVKELASSDKYRGHFRLLQLFAYGTFSEYAAAAQQLPELNQQQMNKLRQLSIVSLSKNSKVLPYTQLQQELHISNIRELEDLIIDAIYLDIIEGKLDQKGMCLRVENAMGRDLKPGETQNLLQVLTDWTETSEKILALIDSELESVTKSDADFSASKALYEKNLESAKADANKASSRSAFHDGEGYDRMDQEGASSRGFAAKKAIRGKSRKQ